MKKLLCILPILVLSCSNAENEAKLKKHTEDSIFKAETIRFTDSLANAMTESNKSVEAYADSLLNAGK